MSVPTALPNPSLALSRPVRDQACIRTSLGQAYDDVLCLKEFRHVAHDQKCSALANVGSGGVGGSTAVGVLNVVGANGGASSVVSTNGGALSVVGTNGGALSVVGKIGRAHV